MSIITDKLLEFSKTFKSVRAMALALDMSPTTLGEYLKGRMPPATLIAQICKAFDVSCEWILTGKGAMFNYEKPTPLSYYHEDFVYVPLLYRVRSEADKPADDGEVYRHLAFRLDWLIKHDFVHSDTEIKKLAAVQLFSDGMAPTMIRGDTLLVDRSQIVPTPDWLFLVRTTQGIIVKRSGGMVGTKLTLLSDNPLIKELVIDMEAEKAKVIGRVIWYGRCI